MPQTSFHYQQLVPYICCVDLLVAFPSYRDVCSLFIPYWDSLVCTFLQAPLLYLNCSTFSPSGPGTWLPEAPANSTPQLEWFGTHFSETLGILHLHTCPWYLYLSLPDLGSSGVSADVSLFKPYFKGRKGDTQRKEVCFTVSHLFWSGSDARKMCTSLMIFLICSSLWLPPQKNTNRNSSLPYLLIKSLCLQ